MQLVHIETRRQDTDLERLLRERAELSGQIVVLQGRATQLKYELQGHLQRRLREGWERDRLKTLLLASGMSQGVCAAFLGTAAKATHDGRPEYARDPRQRQLELDPA